MHLLRILVGWTLISIIFSFLLYSEKFGFLGTLVFANMYLLSMPNGLGVFIWIPLSYCLGWIIVDGTLWLAAKTVQWVFAPSSELSESNQYTATQKSRLYALTEKLDQEYQKETEQ
ncbi:MAG: hypothetical protein BroJett011_00570 [Chloroflexota bacterium]|nr:MAG: hypothetical protein BroJett011_00570 [Chloroflexota bacterium]